MHIWMEHYPSYHHKLVEGRVPDVCLSTMDSSAQLRPAAVVHVINSKYQNIIVHLKHAANSFRRMKHTLWLESFKFGVLLHLTKYKQFGRF